MASTATNENQSGNSDHRSGISPSLFIKVSLCQLFLAGTGVGIFTTYETVIPCSDKNLLRRETVLLVFIINFYVFVATGCCGLLLPACFGPLFEWRKHCALAYMLLNIVSGAFGIVSICFSSTFIHGNDMRVQTVYVSILLGLVVIQFLCCCRGVYWSVVLLRKGISIVLVHSEEERTSSGITTSYGQEEPTMKRPTP